MSVYDRKGKLGPQQREWLRDEIKESASLYAHEYFSSYDEQYAPEQFQRLISDYTVFLDVVYKRAEQREFLSPEEHEQSVANLEAALASYFAMLQQSDQRRLDDYIEAEPAEQEDAIEQTVQQIQEVEGLLEGDLDSSEREKLEQELDILYEQYRFFISQIAQSGDHRARSLTTRAEREQHADSISRFKEKSDQALDARAMAEAIVGEYGKKLIAHKIILGIEAHYSDDEILEHLEEVMPEAQVEELRVQLGSIRAEYDHNRPEAVSTARVYQRVLQEVFRDKKAAAAAFAGGTAMLGWLAPKMAASFGEFGRTGDKMDAAAGAGYGVLAAIGQAELQRHLGKFLNERLYSEVGLADRICASIIQASPEMFTKTDHALIRSYVEQSIGSVEQATSTSVEGIALHATRIIGLSSALAMRMRNPALFAPIAVATALNTFIALKGGSEISEAEQDVRQASASFFQSLDEAMEVKQGKGSAEQPPQEKLDRIEATKNVLVDKIAKFRAGGGLVMPAILLMNALLMDMDQPDAFADYAEASMYSMQLSQDLSELVQEAGRLQRTLRPVVELTTLVQDFRETGDMRPEKWAIELHDVRRKALKVPELRIDPGDTLVVVGESGSGKSTMLEVLYGFQTERGVMMVDEHMPSTLDKRAYREGILVSNQFYTIESKSLRDNLIGGGVRFDEQVFQECLQEHGFDQLLEKINGERENPVERPAEQLTLNRDLTLSGGEKKRLSLLGIDYCLRVDPESVKMIILDEPTSGIDAAHKREIFDRIRQWRDQYPDVTLVIVNHDEGLFDALGEDTRIIGIEKDGRLTQDETLAQARKNEDAPFGKVFGVV